MILLGEWVGARPDKPGALTAWRARLQRADQARLDAKLAMLAVADNLEDLPNLVGPIRVGGKRGKPAQGIFKLRVTTPSLQLRPLFCKRQPPNALVFLVGATERDGKFDPKNAPDTALKRREDVLTKPESWRLYEGP